MSIYFNKEFLEDACDHDGEPRARLLCLIFRDEALLSVETSERMCMTQIDNVPMVSIKFKILRPQDIGYQEIQYIFSLKTLSGAYKLEHYYPLINCSPLGK